jgi:hypothetical protein
MANSARSSLSRLSGSEFDSEDELSGAEKFTTVETYARSRTFSSSTANSDAHILPMAYNRTSSRPSRIRQLLLQHCCVCTPRRFSRYLSLIIISTILLLVITLAHLSSSSTRKVHQGLLNPKPATRVWESFPFLKRYHGGIRKLVKWNENVPEYPPSHDKPEGEKTSNGEQGGHSMPSIAFDVYPSDAGIVPCYLDAEKTIKAPDVRAYEGVPSGMPRNVMGSYDVLGLRDDVCFERFGRLGPYGYGYNKKAGGTGAGLHGDREGVQSVWTENSKVDYRKVKWNRAQSTCFESNKHRFESAGGNGTLKINRMLRRTLTKVPRSAVILRTWNDYEYNDEDILFLRSLIWELSLKTGGEFTVHFLIHVKDNALPIWSDDDTYNKVLKESLPAEFEGMGTLWSERQMFMIYNRLPENRFRDLPLHGVYRSNFMPMVWFSHKHPELEHLWQFEMDLRYTGQYYHLLSKVADWAARQPRKGLWERNARFYVPSEHGSWDEFSHMARVQTEHGTAAKSGLLAGLANRPGVPEAVRAEAAGGKAEKAVWGPEPPPFDKLDTTHDRLPPRGTTQQADKGEWGAGEQADLITFNPLFDPQGTHWLLADDTTGYNTSAGQPPRRTAISTFGRYSRALLSQMHHELAIEGRHMFSEMFPASVALHHGLKAVYAPHPVYIDRRWPTALLAATFNGGRNGQSGGSLGSVFSEEREHNFKGASWYYNAGFAPNLWMRWLGHKVDNDGGEMEEMAGEGRMCLPAMLLHPIKDAPLLYQ